MIRRAQAPARRRLWGDVAVDGLLGGLVGGVGMVLYLAAVNLALGEGLVEVARRFAPDGSSPLAGIILHLAVASVFGVLFALAWWMAVQWFRLPAVLSGLAYGLLLWLLAATLLLPGLGSSLRDYPTIHFALAHLLYGLLLGFSLHRSQNSPS